MDYSNNTQRISQQITKLKLLEKEGNIKEISKNLNYLEQLLQYFSSPNPKDQSNINAFRKYLNKVNKKYQNEIKQGYPNHPLLPSAGTMPIFPKAGTMPILPEAGKHKVNTRRYWALQKPLLKKINDLTIELNSMSDRNLIKVKENKSMFPKAGRKPVNYISNKKGLLERLSNIIKTRLNKIIYEKNYSKLPIERVDLRKIEEILQNIRRGELEMNLNNKISISVKKIYLYEQLNELKKEIIILANLLNKVLEKMD